MILNFSNLDLFEQCQHKYLLRERRRLQPPRIVTMERGVGGHAGISHFHKTGDVQAAMDVAEREVRSAMEHTMILPEEHITWERAVVSARAGVKKYAETYSKLTYTVLRTEVRFLQPIPNTEHHCQIFHDILEKCGRLTHEAGIVTHTGEVFDPTHSSKLCWRPHYAAGITDAVISLNSEIWLQDHKFSGFKAEMFFRFYELDFQGTLYCWGIQQETGITPKGFVINKIGMPTKRQMADDVDFESEPYLRNALDYGRMLAWATDVGNEIESRIIATEAYGFAVASREFRINPKACYDYQRECPYHNVCMQHDSPESLEDFEVAPPRYYDALYYDILCREGTLTWSDVPQDIRELLHTEALKEVNLGGN